MSAEKAARLKTRPPRVTVLMAVYNSESYLRAAIDSILCQTFSDFEFLIINDGSTDTSREIILSYKDARIRLVDNPANLGLTRSLNLGLSIVKGSLIARQDADDISNPTRLARQIAFMDAHSEVVLLGTQARLIDHNGRRIRGTACPRAVTKPGIRWQMMTNSAFIHTSVMFRREIIWDVHGGYNAEFRVRQDAELWSRLAAKYEVANLPDALVEFRVHLASISANYGNKSDDHIFAILRSNLHRYLQPDVVPSDSWIRIHLGSFSGQALSRREDGFELIEGLCQIQKGLTKQVQGRADEAELRNLFGYQLTVAALYLATRNRTASLLAIVRSGRAKVFPPLRIAAKYMILLLGGEVARQGWRRWRVQSFEANGNQ